MKKISFILLSGGIGTRMKMNVPKQFLLLGGKPTIVHVLEKLETIEQISEIIIPSPENHLFETKRIIKSYQFTKPIKVIEGGGTRQESTYFALKHVTNDTVVVHEAVRPFVTKDEFMKLINCPDENATYGLDIPFTVLEGSAYIEKNLERDKLINIQLPQKFNAKAFLAAHEQARAEGEHFTEDASLFFKYNGGKIKVLEGTEYNIKITKPLDRKIAEIIYSDFVLGRSKLS
ncbi:IspD/TarI family cytidylyltransferase [Numidum massiliense]|uniref:IspD/TarI family cytidylyltransferase n=1 Tax=Numidum massiliense TaxID=1522315 RepID=UPI0006D52E02|nr:IspD/TarI family cytidylyltransferase [Numidum massiliense]